MKISEVIEELNAQLEEYGDLQVYSEDGDKLNKVRGTGYEEVDISQIPEDEIIVIR